jgi:HTH-type transcriptional regulator / antitoxin HigA
MEMTTALDSNRITDYGELLRELQPRVITSERQASRYLDVIDTLTDLPEMSAGQREIVALLGQLVYDWEEEHEEPITATPAEMVRFLLEENDLPQSALVPEVFPNRQNVSEFLAGKRRISYDRAAKLAAFFHLSPATFYPVQ